jgi:hypothetical protein
MNRAEAVGLYQHMLAVWPSAHEQHDEPTARVWVDYLAGLDVETAREALSACKRSLRFFPSIADVERELVAVRQQRRYGRTVPALEAPVRSDTARRFLEMVRPLLDERRKTVGERELDAAGVLSWRERLADASRRDGEDGSHRRWFDEAWQSVRAEYRARLVGED